MSSNILKGLVSNISSISESGKRDILESGIPISKSEEEQIPAPLSLRDELNERRQKSFQFSLDDNLGIKEDQNEDDPTLFRLHSNRSSLKRTAHYMETKQFNFSEQFPIKKQKRKLTKEHYKSNIEENLGGFSKVPKIGIQPITVDLIEQSRKRNNIEYKKFVPSGFKDDSFQALKKYNEFSIREKVVGVNQLETKNEKNITLIRIENQDLSKMRVTQKLNKFKRTVVLMLKNTKIGNAIKSLHLPKLRFLDLTGNNISSYTVITTILDNSQDLENLIVVNNSLMQNDVIWKEHFIVHGGKLKMINFKPITKREQDIAISKFGSAVERRVLNYQKWVDVVGKICRNVHLVKWEPGRFTTLSVCSAGVEEFQVGVFVNLKKLDISENKIKKLTGSGLERLVRLKYFNFSKNQITKIEELNILRYLSSIKEIIAVENPFPEKLQQIRYKIIYETREAKGTNDCYGMTTLNGDSITLEERILASQTYAKGHEIQQNRYLRWAYLLIKRFGHRQLRCIPHFSNKIKILDFPRTKLQYVDVSGFKRLEYLDLRSNYLKSLIGIGELKKLAFLDISVNPDLDHEVVLKDLTKISNLQSVILFRYSRVQEHLERRKRILKVLVPPHPKLHALDRVEISFQERVESLEDILNTYQLKTYKFNLSVMTQVVPMEKQMYSHRKVRPKQLYRPEDIVELRLNGFGLEDIGCNFDIFTNLEMADLSNNQFIEIKETGITNCKSLRVMDLRNNKITYNTKQLVEFFDNFKYLEVIALNENPCYKSLKKKDGRMNFLKKLKIMSTVGSRLMVVDSDVTNQERMDVMKHHGIIQKSDDSERFNDVMETRGYLDCSPSEITEINLVDSNLRKINLDPFTNVTVLLLRGNRIQSLTKIKHMDTLKILDVRKNELTEIEEVIDLARSLKYLESLGFSGNVFYFKSQVLNIREYVIGSLPKLRKFFSNLWEIDEIPITLDEIVTSWCKMSELTEASTDKISEFRFESLIFRKFATNIEKNEELKAIKVTRSQFIELNLCSRKLRVINFRDYKNLNKLSLRNNDISDKQIIESGLHRCKKLQHLDLSKNKVHLLRSFADLLERLTELLSMSLDQNPCYQEENDNSRFSLLGSVERIDDIGFKLTRLNDKFVTIDDKCNALKKSHRGITDRQIELIRTKLIVENQGYDGKEKRISLVGKGITRIELLLTFENVTHLDLSSNNITRLPEVMIQMKNLKNINLQNNKLSLEAVVDSLRLNQKITHVSIKGNKGCDNPQEYLIEVILTMRGLKYIDDYFNPFCLNSEQIIAVEYFEKYFGLSRNSFRNIDLNHKNIESSHFWAIVLALRTLTVYVEIGDGSYIGPKSLSMNVGNFENSFISNYRYVVISHLQSLEKLDEKEINEAEKTTANTIKDRFEKLIPEKIEKFPFISSTLDFCTVKNHIWNTIDAELKNEDEEDDLSLGSDEDEEEDIIIKEKPLKPEKEAQFDKDVVEQLVGMGYEFEKAKQACIEAKDNLIMAAEILIKGGGGGVKKKREGIVGSFAVTPVSKEQIDYFGDKKKKDEEMLKKKKDTGIHSKHLHVPGKKDVVGSFAVTPVSSVQEDYFSKNKKEGEKKKRPKKEGGDKKKRIKLDDINFKYIEKNHEDIGIFPVYFEILNETNQSVRSLGNLVEKAEQIIFFLQMFAIIFSFDIDWPKLFRVIFEWLSLFLLGFENISFIESSILYGSRINYLRYILTMPIPLFLFILFIVLFSRKRWMFFLHKLKYFTCLGIFLLWIFGISMSILFAFVFDDPIEGHSFGSETWNGLFPSNSTQSHSPPTTSFWIIFISLLFLATIVCILLFLNLIIFNIWKNDTNFWRLFYVKFRRRLAFFLLTISYFPLMRMIFSAFECKTSLIEVNQNATHVESLRLYYEQMCPNFASTGNFWEWIGMLPVMWWISTIFGIFYGIGIPIILFIMVWKDWTEMYRHFSIEQDDKKEKTAYEKYLKSGKKKEFYEQYKKRKHENSRHYHRCSLDYNSAPSFLYAPFKRKFKYYKIFQIIERLILSFLASLLIGQYISLIQIGLGVAVLTAFCLFSIVFRIYDDKTQNMLDVSNRVTNILNLVFGIVLQLNKMQYIDLSSGWFMPDSYFQPACIFLFAWNAINIILNIIFLIVPFVEELIKFIKEGKKERKVKKDQDQQREEEGEVELKNVVKKNSDLIGYDNEKPVTFTHSAYVGFDIDPDKLGDIELVKDAVDIRKRKGNLFKRTLSRV